LLGISSYIDKNFPVSKVTISKENSALNFSADSIQLISLGHARLISSILWISTLIEGDIEHYKGEGNSWMYYRFLSIAKLEPYFYQNYLFGGQYLSIIKDDTEGANSLYHIGLKYYPSDYWINYHTAFNLIFELKRYNQGAEILERIMNNPIAHTYHPYIYSIVQKIKLNNGSINLMDAYTFLQDQLTNATTPQLKKGIEVQRNNIKTELDLDCLNRGDKNCDTTDYFGQSYIKNYTGSWQSQSQWRKFKLYDK